MFKNIITVRSRKAVLIISSVVVIFLAGGIYLFLSRQKNTDIQNTTQSTDQTLVDDNIAKSLEENQQIIEAYRQELNKANNNYINTIKSLDDLRNIESSEKDRIGIVIINRLIEIKQSQDAQPYIEYVMNFKTGYGLEAAKLCYATANSSDRKDWCLGIINTRAIEQGIINEGESLPEDYYQTHDGETG